MTNGETIFVLFISDAHDKVWVTEYTVLDAGNRVVRNVKTGDVKVMSSWMGIETIHATEAEAWSAAARQILAYAEKLRLSAGECLKKAAAGRIVAVPA